MADGRKNYFSLEYVKQNGEIGKITQALKHKPGDSVTEATREPSRSHNHHMKYSGNVRVYSIDKGGYRELMIDTLCKFQGIKISHT